jgi:hypothetical protein
MTSFEHHPRRGTSPSHLRVDLPPRANLGSPRSADLSPEEIEAESQKALGNLDKSLLEIYAPWLHRLLGTLLPQPKKEF